RTVSFAHDRQMTISQRTILDGGCIRAVTMASDQDAASTNCLSAWLHKISTASRSECTTTMSVSSGFLLSACKRICEAVESTEKIEIVNFFEHKRHIGQEPRETFFFVGALFPPVRIRASPVQLNNQRDPLISFCMRYNLRRAD